jgi:cytolysin-activating lysine-acyltransferase
LPPLLDYFAYAIGRNPAERQSLRRVDFHQPPPRDEELKVIGSVLWLCRHSSLHAVYSVGMLNCRILPSLPLGQFRLYLDPEGAPFAFCNWVWVNAEVLAELLETGRDLRPEEFKCGDLPFCYEFIAPFGHARAVARDLRQSDEFQGRRIRAIRCKVANDGRRSMRVAHAIA